MREMEELYTELVYQELVSAASMVGLQEEHLFSSKRLPREEADKRALVIYYVCHVRGVSVTKIASASGLSRAVVYSSYLRAGHVLLQHRDRLPVAFTEVAGAAS